MSQSGCDTCVYYTFDEEDEAYSCDVNMDEDDAARLIGGTVKECPYYKSDNEYEVVRHQM